MTIEQIKEAKAEIERRKKKNIDLKKIDSKYTNEELINIAKNYNSRADLSKNRYYLLKLYKYRGIEDEAFSHFKGKNKRWNMESSIEAAKKCKTRGEFSKKYPGAYSFLNRRKLIDKACSHTRKVIGEYYGKKKWTKENCIELAIKCSSFKEFRLAYNGCYQASVRYGWGDEIKAYFKRSEVMK